jgi:hypothetical protein
MRPKLFLFCCIVFVFCAVQLVATEFYQASGSSELGEYSFVIKNPEIFLRIHPDGKIEIWPRRILRGIKLNWEE